MPLDESTIGDKVASSSRPKGAPEVRAQAVSREEAFAIETEVDRRLQFSGGQPITRAEADDIARQYEQQQQRQTSAQESANIEVDEEEEDAAGDDQLEQAEAVTARVLSCPVQPTKQQVEEHNLTHLPFRNWCPACVGGRAKNQPHRKQLGRDEQHSHGLCISWAGEPGRDAFACDQRPRI